MTFRKIVLAMGLVLIGQSALATSGYSYNCSSSAAFSKSGQPIAIALLNSNAKQSWYVNYTIRGAEPKDDRTIYIDTSGVEDKSKIQLSLSSAVGISYWADNSMEKQIDTVVASPVQGFISVVKSSFKNQFKGEAALPFINGHQKIQINCTKVKDSKPNPGCLFCL
jgi:hypothetical protein